MFSSDFISKLEKFIAVVEMQRNEYTKQRYANLHENAVKTGFAGYHCIGYDKGLRFFRVWESSNPGNVNKGVRFFVEVETGKIFGAKSWKIYNPARQFGTLDTLNEWDWSDYSPIGKHGQNSLVPKEMRK